MSAFAKALDTAARDGRAWGLLLEPDGELVGPLTGFRRRTPDVVVALVDPEDVPAGDATGTIDVAESGAGAFTVTTERHAGGWAGVHHPVGGNRVVWSPDGATMLVSRSSSVAASWVHARFVLRHRYIAAAAARPGHGVTHTVVARSAAGGVLVGGPTLSGKTRLANRLVERGALGEVVEDDCPVVAPDGSIRSLIPTMHELRRVQELPVTVAVAMVDGADAALEWSAPEMARWLGGCQVPWPAPWLPFAGPRGGSPVPLAPSTRCLAVPARADEWDGVVDEVVALIDQSA